jgi:hypothetical protein
MMEDATKEAAVAAEVLVFDALIAGAYLAGADTRRVRPALAAAFAGQSARMWSPEPGARRRSTGMLGTRARSPTSRSSAHPRREGGARLARQKGDLWPAAGCVDSGLS